MARKANHTDDGTARMIPLTILDAPNETLALESPDWTGNVNSRREEGNGDGDGRIGLNESGHCLAQTVLAEVNLFTFDQEVLQSPQPVLVEFWAGWCRSSKSMKPMLRSLAEEHRGVLRVASVNVERSEGLAERFLVRAVPTLLIFQGGVVRDQLVGSSTERDLRERLEPFL